MPTEPLTSVISVVHPTSELFVNLETQFIAPFVAAWCSGDAAPDLLSGVTPLSSVDGGASMNADAGLPPSVSASPALKAYGTPTNNTRGCSSSSMLDRTPNHRDSVDDNTSTGTP